LGVRNSHTLPEIQLIIPIEKVLLFHPSTRILSTDLIFVPNLENHPGRDECP
jgi:hypothetical protein